MATPSSSSTTKKASSKARSSSSHKAARAADKAKDLASSAGGTAARAVPAPPSGRKVRVPVVGASVTVPPPDRLAFYTGVGAMAALELVDWPVALIVAAGHAVATRSRNPAVKGAAEGTESAA